LVSIQWPFGQFCWAFLLVHGKIRNPLIRACFPRSFFFGLGPFFFSLVRGPVFFFGLPDLLTFLFLLACFSPPQTAVCFCPPPPSHFCHFLMARFTLYQPSLLIFGLCRFFVRTPAARFVFCYFFDPFLGVNQVFLWHSVCLLFAFGVFSEALLLFVLSPPQLCASFSPFFFYFLPNTHLPLGVVPSFFYPFVIFHFLQVFPMARFCCATISPLELSATRTLFPSLRELFPSVLFFTARLVPLRSLSVAGRVFPFTPFFVPLEKNQFPHVPNLGAWVSVLVDLFDVFFGPPCPSSISFLSCGIC